jgi:hypothetical protein
MLISCVYIVLHSLYLTISPVLTCKSEGKEWIHNCLLGLNAHPIEQRFSNHRMSAMVVDGRSLRDTRKYLGIIFINNDILEMRITLS